MDELDLLELNLEKRHGDFHLSIRVEMGAEWLVLLAPSGGGKSLLLNLISGVVQPDAGRVRLGGETLFDKERGIRLPIRKRQIGYLFQDYALFPHLSVSQNIAYGVPRGRHSGEEVKKWLRFFELEQQAHAYPRHLSGG